MRTAFLGLGQMGLPMATHLAGSGANLVVWNRSPGAATALVDLGADVADSAAAAIAASEVVIVMLADERVVDLVLDRDGPAFAGLAGRTLVQMGTTSPSYSLGLGRAVEAAGGRYVEAPVSGSRVPAELAQLVAMVAGPPTSCRSSPRWWRRCAGRWSPSGRCRRRWPPSSRSTPS